MDKKNINSGPSTDSYFFQIHPNFFKVEYGFAKTLKSNTSYRLAIYKGIQKADEMSTSIKAKIVRGKILFEENVLNFYLPIYSPGRNMQFSLKIYETKINQKEAQIASHQIKFGDYITKFRQNGVSQVKEEISLLEDFTLNFDIFVHSSKIQLERILKQRKAKLSNENRVNVIANKVKTPKNNLVESESISLNQKQSQTNSHQNVVVVNKMISRKRKNSRQIKSKHGSRQKNDDLQQSQGQVRNSKNKVPRLHQDGGKNRYISPKKPFTPKVNQDAKYFPKVSLTQNKTKNLVSVSRKDSHASEINQNFSSSPKSKLSKAQSSIQQSEFIRQLSYTQHSDGIEDFQRPTKRNIFAKRQKTIQAFPKIDMNQSPSPIASSINKTIESKMQNTENEIPRDQIVKNSSQKQRKNSFKASSPTENKNEKNENEKCNIESQNTLKSMSRRFDVDRNGSFLTNNKIKASQRLRASQFNEMELQDLQKDYQILKNQIFYFSFLVISILLFYNVLTPSRKV